MPHDGHDHSFTGSVFTGDDPTFRRILWLIIALNGAMFVVEFVAGAISGSLALQADSLDFAMDAATYGLSLAVISMAPATRAKAALLKAASLGLIAAWVLGAALWRVFVVAVPEPFTMGGIAIVAFLANVASVALLWRWREGDANIRSVWLCSRNDALGNLLVLAAAAGVFGTGSRWPDLAVAAVMSGLFLQTAILTARRAVGELRAQDGHAGHAH